MRFTQGSIGRVFVLRLDDGDPLNETLEGFAREHHIVQALAFYVGGAAPGSQVVVGPDTARDDAVIPLLHTLAGPHEALAVGTIFPNEAGEPSAHMHAACGREGSATVGCARAGLETWLVGEIVLLEIVDADAVRVLDTATGFELLGLS